MLVSILMFILYLLVASACAWIAYTLVPGGLPGGFLATAIVGIIGEWIGTKLIGDMGPSLLGVPLVPAILGSALLVFLFSLFSRRWWRYEP